MSVGILVPVLNRPVRIAPLVANIHDATPEPHKIYFAASDESSVGEIERAGEWLLRDDGDTYANRINRLFHATTEPYLLLAADDYQFYPGWLPPLLDKMAEVDGIVVADDLHNPNGTICLVSRNYINELSGCVDTPNVVLHTYAHNFCDNELFETAASRGRFARCPESIIEHMHWCAGKGEIDATYEMGMSGWIADEALFHSRRHLWAN